MVSANDLKRRMMIMIEGEPYQVAEVSVSLPSARGASTMVRVKARHILNGMMCDKNFKAAEKFKEAEIDIAEANFSYKDEHAYYFMDQATYETIELSKEAVGDAARYLVDGLVVKIMTYKGSSVSLELPDVVPLKVVETELAPLLAGSAGGGTKNATLETGLVVKVPKYVVSGETVRVNTETGEVAGRA
ncbi:MAG: elongation factor P [Deltaproteobacteria bacterium]